MSENRFSNLDDKLKSDKTEKLGVADVSSPFYISNSDHPGLNLVSHQLDGENYKSWSRAMTMALTTKNKIFSLTVTFLFLILMIQFTIYGLDVIALSVLGY